MRGQVFEIEGKTFFTMGGAASHDKEFRREGISWWPGEMPSQEEYAEAERNLEKHNWNVDYVITHCGPTSLQAYMSADYKPDELTTFFDSLYERLKWKMWYMGHYHRDEICGWYRLLYHDILEIRYDTEERREIR